MRRNKSVHGLSLRSAVPAPSDIHGLALVVRVPAPEVGGDPHIMMQLSQWMTREMETVAPDTPLSKVVPMVARDSQVCVFVLDQGRLVGLISDQECVDLLQQLLEGKALVTERCAADVMNRSLITVP